MQTFPGPFSRAYWRAAARELKDTRKLVFAALIMAICVATRPLSLFIGKDLKIMLIFLPYALGSLVYGPVVALLVGAGYDLLGVMLFPQGSFFPPFTLLEMLKSFLFAIFLYRAPFRFWRVAVSKLLYTIVCNILLTPLMLAWMMGGAATLASLPRVIKNAALYPLETLLLALLLGAMYPVLVRTRFAPGGQTAFRLTARHYAMLGALTLLSAASVLLYIRFFAAA